MAVSKRRGLNNGHRLQLFQPVAEVVERQAGGDIDEPWRIAGDVGQRAVARQVVGDIARRLGERVPSVTACGGPREQMRRAAANQERWLRRTRLERELLTVFFHLFARNAIVQKGQRCV